MSNGVLHNNVYNIPPHFDFSRPGVYTYESDTRHSDIIIIYYFSPLQLIANFSHVLHRVIHNGVNEMKKLEYFTEII
jgi:hypothetical protein